MQCVCSAVMRCRHVSHRGDHQTRYVVFRLKQTLPRRKNNTKESCASEELCEGGGREGIVLKWTELVDGSGCIEASLYVITGDVTERNYIQARS